MIKSLFYEQNVDNFEVGWLRVNMSNSENTSNLIIIHLSNTFFNVLANNFTLVLNRNEVAYKLTMKIVIELKRIIGMKFHTKLKMIIVCACH